VGRRALLALTALTALSALSALSALGVALAACAPEASLDDAACPPGGSALTYDTFGRAFLEQHCQTCHGATERQGAPASFDFATLAAVQRHKARIFARAAADNMTMPPGPDDPPREERDKLAEWLACGAP
jgi:uncharacterized membrane protein